LYAYHQYLCGNSIIGEVCVVTGSLSNLIDRVVYHGVIDFIILSYNDFSWPVFNIADTIIVLGVGIMIFQYEQ
jgi:signal peptidase II